MKQSIMYLVGCLGAGASYLLGGIDTSVVTLLMFMAIDYITGLICAGVFHTSPKSINGALESRAGWKGLCKKGVTLLFVVIAVRLDMELGTTYIKDGVCIAFTANELVSITENAGLMGVGIPEPILNAIDVLKKQKGE